MRHLFLKTHLLLVLITISFGCTTEEETALETGLLDLSFEIDIDVATEASNSRSFSEVDAPSLDDFTITIYTVNGDEFITFDSYSEVPDFVTLPVGTYYIEAQTNNSDLSGFHEPYFFGRSITFEIEKEEIKVIPFEASIANAQININWSDNVKNSFEDYLINIKTDNNSHVIGKDDISFTYVPLEPIYLEVSLTFIKNDGSEFIKTFSQTITPQAKTRYHINIDAEATEDVIINLSINTDLNDVDIDLVEVDEGSTLNWQRTILGNHEIQTIEPTTDGGFIMVGKSDLNFLAIKMSASGDLEWSKTYALDINKYNNNSYSPHSVYDNVATNVTSLSSGGYAISGVTTFDYNNLDPIYGGTSYSDANGLWVIKIDKNGDLIWENFIHEEFEDQGGPNTQVIEANDNNLLVCSTIFFRTPGGIQYHSGSIIKFSETGEMLWKEVLGGSLPSIFHSISEGYISGEYIVFETVQNKSIVFNRISQNGDVESSNTLYEANNGLQGKKLDISILFNSIPVTMLVYDQEQFDLLEINPEDGTVIQTKPMDGLYGPSSIIQNNTNGDFIITQKSDASIWEYDYADVNRFWTGSEDNITSFSSTNKCVAQLDDLSLIIVGNTNNGIWVASTAAPGYTP